MNIFKQEKVMTMIEKPVMPHHKGITKLEVELVYSWDHDNSKPDFDYGSKEENEKEMKRFESGELINALFRVEAIAYGFSEAEYIGQCFIKTSDMEIQLLELANEEGLKDSAINALKSTMRGNYQVLKSIFE